MGSNKKQRNDAVVKQNQGVTYTGHFEGPLPPPVHLADYEEICPGAADRIITMAENQAGHRQDIERRVIKSQSINSLAGIICGFLLGLASIGAGAWIVITGHSLEGLGAMFMGIAALVGTFVYGKRANVKEIVEKQKLVDQLKR